MKETTRQAAINAASAIFGYKEGGGDIIRFLFEGKENWNVDDFRRFLEALLEGMSPNVEEDQQIDRLAETVGSGVPVMCMPDEYVGAVNYADRFRRLIWIIVPRVPSAQDVVRCELQLQGISDLPLRDEALQKDDVVLILKASFSEVGSLFRTFPLDPMQFAPIPDGYGWKDLSLEKYNMRMVEDDSYVL